MIEFRCWYCNRRFSMKDDRIGQQLTCTCKRLLKVPKKSGGNCRVKTPTDWLVETLVYGGGGALLFFFFALMVLRFMPRGRGMFGFGWIFLSGSTLFGLAFGALGGERGLTWLGRMFRDLDDKLR
jgi:hypothetical protein